MSDPQRPGPPIPRRPAEVLDPADMAEVEWGGALWIAGAFKGLAVVALIGAAVFVAWAVVGESDEIDDIGAVSIAVGWSLGALFLGAVGYVIELLVGIWAQLLGIRLLQEGNEPED
jgi:hypothetical protein